MEPERGDAAASEQVLQAAASRPPPADASSPFTDQATRGDAAYLWYPNGAGRSKLGAAVFERGLGVAATARDLLDAGLEPVHAHPGRLGAPLSDGAVLSMLILPAVAVLMLPVGLGGPLVMPPVTAVLQRLAAMRAYQRSKHVDNRVNLAVLGSRRDVDWMYYAGLAGVRGEGGP